MGSIGNEQSDLVDMDCLSEQPRLELDAMFRQAINTIFLQKRLMTWVEDHRQRTPLATMTRRRRKIAISNSRLSETNHKPNPLRCWDCCSIGNGTTIVPFRVDRKLFKKLPFMYFDTNFVEEDLFYHYFSSNLVRYVWQKDSFSCVSFFLYVGTSYCTYQRHTQEKRDNTTKRKVEIFVKFGAKPFVRKTNANNWKTKTF